MTPHDEAPEEKELQALFDATAQEPSNIELNRMAARAVDVPKRGRSWLWGYVFGGALAAAAAAGAFWIVKPTVPGVPSASPHEAPSAVEVASALPEASPEIELAALDDIDDDGLDLLAELDEIDEDAEADFGLGLLEAPSDEAEVDDWLLAAAELLEEDG